MSAISSTRLGYALYRESNCSNEEIKKEIIEQIKDYVYDKEGIILNSQGYSGVPLYGHSKILLNEMDLCKTLDVFFYLTTKFPGLVFSISTDIEELNPFFIDCDKDDVLPKWVQNARHFNTSVFGMNGVLHCVSPEQIKEHPKVPAIELIRRLPRETRNILITEAVKQRIRTAADRRFGMHRMSVNLPEHLAYVARQRPDLLSLAIREFSNSETNKDLEEHLESTEKVMVHVELNTPDYKVVTDVACIDAPPDIVSHRLGIALLKFDAKYSNCQNGELLPIDASFKSVEDSFERERMMALSVSLTGKPLSTAHQYQSAIENVTDEHKQICRNVFRDDVVSSTDQKDTDCSGDDEDPIGVNRNKQRKQVYTKKRGGGIGKKRTLAAVLPLKNTAPSAPAEFDSEVETPTPSGQLRNFERAVNGDDVYYKESSEEKSLGEEEEQEFFAIRSRPVPMKVVNGHQLPVGSPPRGLAEESEDGFDVSELLNAAPPLATNDEFDDI